MGPLIDPCGMLTSGSDVEELMMTNDETLMEIGLKPLKHIATKTFFADAGVGGGECDRTLIVQKS